MGHLRHFAAPAGARWLIGAAAVILLSGCGSSSTTTVTVAKRAAPVRRAPPTRASRGLPILAGPWAADQKGYGRVKPTRVYNGGKETGLVRRILWLSWGGVRAVGTGLGWYVGPHQSVTQATEEPARIVAFELGYCDGRRAYDAIEWYFPENGGHFSPHTYIDACTGKRHE